MKIGAHMSAAGGYAEALSRVAAIGGNCLQIFSASPRGWNTPKISPADAKKLTVDDYRAIEADDADADGASNKAEMDAGTNPSDAASVPAGTKAPAPSTEAAGKAP